MEKKFFYILLPLLLTVGLASAQDYTFKVLANKGQNQVKKESGELAMLKTGAELYDLDEIVSPEGAYVGLVHKSGKTMEVRGAGNRKVVDLAAKVDVRRTSAASRYAQFIAAKMAEGEGNANRNRTNTVGAVTRGFGDMAVLLPSTSVEVFANEAIVRWMPADSTESGIKYTVTITNVFEEILYTEETEDEFVSLSFEEMENESDFYIFNVRNSDDPGMASENIGIKKIGASDQPDVAEGRDKLLSELENDSPLSRLILASFYEENGLLLDALTQYEMVVQEAPEVEDFMTLYNTFLINNGILKVEEE